MEIVHQLHLWLMYRSVLVKEKVGNSKRDLRQLSREKPGCDLRGIIIIILYIYIIIIIIIYLQNSDTYNR